MKIRHGFVSNSSSSSFIIAYRGSKPCSHCGRSDHDLKNAIEQATMSNYDDNELYADGLDETIAYLEKEEMYLDPDEKNKMIKELREVPKDMHIIYFKVSMHDDLIHNLIGNIEKSNSGKIIWREGY